MLFIHHGNEVKETHQRDTYRRRRQPLIDLRPTRANPACGACRTRESKVWWKAPKGLATNILCDTCGSNWRKYADLNVQGLSERNHYHPPQNQGN